MNPLEKLVSQIATLLEKQRQSWALVGGLAVSVRSEPRFTRDLDIAVTVADDSSAEHLVHSLCASGFRAVATVEQEATHRLSTVRLVPLTAGTQALMLDILFASSGIEAEICAEAERLHVFQRCLIPVARMHHLIALKALARDDRTRPQDAVDLRHLISVADEADLLAACDAARLIETRGFNRSRNLVAAVMHAWQEFRAIPS
ncbi:MAG TPA: nucleotidyl transferase AbiEii/AbiGii toxin family protein [Kiritimatiellia bacterium]|jgi:predicted nucleotidyltransferase|nr:nucleotidyl transferase AbiEii/AbiGii toxin family protein [Kiritimatiellia bacterium]